MLLLEAMTYDPAPEWKHYLTASILVLEIVIRLKPTGKDESILNRLLSVVTYIADKVPNRAKRGSSKGCFKAKVKSEFKQDP